MATETVEERRHGEVDREHLIKHLWPDKALYAAMMLFLTGFMGLLTGAIELTVGFSYSPNTPAFFSEYPAWLIMAASVVTGALGLVALIQRSLVWAQAGALAGIASLGFLGIDVVLALIAFVFIYKAKQEREDTNPATRVLTADMWPDKSLAGSMTLLIGGIVTLAWGLGITFDLVTFNGYFGGRYVFGPLVLFFALIALIAARAVYYQRGASLGLVASIGVMLSVGLWIIGPILGLAALVLVQAAEREEEFEDA